MKGYFNDELVKEFKIGEALGSLRFTAVVFDADDVGALMSDPRTRYWVRDTLFCRLAPKGVA